MQFAQGLTYKHYDEKEKRRYKRTLTTDQEKIAYIKQEYERRRIERLYFELKWQLNMAFIEGEQYQYISNITNDLVEYPKMLKAQEREAYNHILPIWTTRLAKLSRLNQIFKARPASNDSDDINNAHITTMILQKWSNDNELNKAQTNANAWMEATGTAVWKNIWNTNKGKKLGLAEDGSYIREGNVENVVCSPFEIFPDSSYNSDVEYCKSIIHARAVDIDYIYDNFGVDLPGERLNVFASGLHVIQNLNNQLKGSDTKKKDDVIMLYEFYEIPTKAYPDGRFLICCDNHNKLLYEGELPYINSDYNNRELPFKIQRSIIRPGYFWGKSIIDSLIPVQRRYNAIKNRMTEYLASVAVGVTIVDATTAENNNLETEGIAPGDIIIYDKSDNTQIPTYMQAPPLPNEFFNQENADLANFTKMSGVSEISRDSSAPTGIESGKALTVLNEQDETRISLTARQVQDCMLGVAKQTAYLYKQFADNQRLLRIVGKGDAVKLLHWDKNTITADDIIIEGLARISETLTQKRNMIIELINIGLFRDEQGRIDDSAILEKLEFGDADVSLDSKRLQKIKSNEQNIKMSVGQPQPVEFYELHAVAVDTHVEYMLSAEFETLEEPIKELFKKHIAEHIQYIQRQAIQQQEQQNQPQQGQRKQIDIDEGSNI
jgi:hypothetical protein